MFEYRYRYRYFYRVEDEYSQAVTTPGKGISAAGRADINLGATYGYQADELRWNLQNHLDWKSNDESPFISVYDDEDVALSIAEGRKEKLGREHVTVTKIDVSKVSWSGRVSRAAASCRAFGCTDPGEGVPQLGA